MSKKFVLAAQLLFVAFLVKFLDGDSGSDSDSGSSDSDSGSTEACSDVTGSSLDSSDSGNSSNSSQRKPQVGVNPEDLLNNLSQEDLSQIPRRH
ncbi:MAG: hypothetical protein JWP00_2514 [Chloroflexi bacterium]|jgi:hypothetical protein|nr:hypothetical protein [Chloroflexota bacterium]